MKKHIISCTECSRDHANLLFHCPTCGKQLVTISPEKDILVFAAKGGWRLECLVSFNGLIQSEISRVEFNPQALTVFNGSEQRQSKSIARLDLLGRLTRRIEVLEL